MAIEKHEFGYISFDIERTGRSLKSEFFGDETFAFGIADAPYNAYNASEISSAHVCLDLKKPSDVSWDDFWKEKKFEQRCFLEFWSKSENIEVLDKLQNPKEVSLVSDEADFVMKINTLLEEAESRYKESMVALDAPLFDPVFISHLLMKYGYMPLNFTRDGRYRSSWEIDSYVAGLANTTPQNWRDSEIFKKEHLKPFYVEERVHDHHPENDAKSILLTALAAVKSFNNTASGKRPRSP